MADTLVYVYAVGDAALAGSELLRRLHGIDGQPVRTIVSGQLAAVVSSVDATRFDQEALRRRFEDLNWLEETARTHHWVVGMLARSNLIAPLRLATMYRNDANVSALLEEQAAGLSETLERIRGRTEWGVKAFAVPAAAPPDDHPTGQAAVGPGTSYLRRRSASRDRAGRQQQRAECAATEVHQKISELAVASRRYPPQDPQLSGHRDAMVLNAAYLIDQADTDTLRREIDHWDTDVLRLELTGPWAPYSFATLDER